ncbi:alcohol dehydrogenase catalytic domain-containing protein [Gordonia sp. 135]|uniref:NAD(P)-dependent alcohol dehydrogenase n=1 Tax=Gordonia sp. 135 TaxID=2676309 RepID=UPI0012BB1F2C|nr:NAD(P)-dependent alcohol dehydrogenase [Gordonia sp. 135]QGP89785.1 alcohol dehydrogenase catalytic domain-containing protein [Gordonia sp. 135]
MKALQYKRIGGPLELVDVPRPSPGPGQVLLRVTAAGLCHSDLHIIEASADDYRFGPLPMTLGHEAAGTVAAVGAGADQFELGTPTLVYGPWGCGVCRECSYGRENYCTHPDGVHPPGIAVDGAMGEYLLVDSERHLVPLGDLDPVQAVALTDAGLTSYHAVKQSLPRLGAGTVALVIGVGGLGHIAIQIIRALSAARVIAVDISPDKLNLAREVGADDVVIGDSSAEQTIWSMTAERGVDAVFDFVGAQPTADLAGRVARTHAEITVIGVGGGAIPVGYRRLAFEASVRSTFWGSRGELWEVIDLARAGRLHIEVETHPLADAPQVYARLARGEILGRAVVVP